MLRPVMLIADVVIVLATWSALLVFALIGFLNGGILGVLALFVELVVVLPPAILAHELGHIIAGWSVGFRFRLLMLGPLRLRWTGKSLRIQFVWPWNHWGGVVLAAADGRYRRWPMFVKILGGPLANILLGLLFLLLASRFETPAMPLLMDAMREVRDRFPSALTLWLVFAGVVNLFLGFGNLMPRMEKRASNADGVHLRYLLLGGSGGERHLALYSLTVAMLDGLRPRDWDPTVIERLTACPDGTLLDVSADLYGYYHWLDSGQIDRAGALLDAALALYRRYPSGQRPSIALEGAFFEAFFRRNKSQAENWLARSKSGFAETHTRLRAEAAVLLSDGRCAEARAVAERALAAADRSIDVGGSRAEIDWLRAIVEECRKSSREPSV